MHFVTKNYLKNNRYHITKHPLITEYTNTNLYFSCQMGSNYRIERENWILFDACTEAF
jgi:hypothetical protein